MKKTTKTKYLAYNPTTGEYAKNWYSTTKNFNLAAITTYETARRNAVSNEKAHYNGHRPTEGEWEVREVRTTITVGLDHVEDESGLAPWEEAVAFIEKGRKIAAHSRAVQKQNRRAELEAELAELDED